MFENSTTITLPVSGADFDSLVCRIYYSLGGLSYWDYKVKPRGYYLSVTPAKSERPGIRCEWVTDSVGAFLKEVSRKSDKAGREARSLATDALPGLVDRIRSKFGLSPDAVTIAA